jgi:hypothetical protein
MPVVSGSRFEMFRIADHTSACAANERIVLHAPVKILHCSESLNADSSRYRC